MSYFCFGIIFWGFTLSPDFFLVQKSNFLFHKYGGEFISLQIHDFCVVIIHSTINSVSVLFGRIQYFKIQLWINSCGIFQWLPHHEFITVLFCFVFYFIFYFCLFINVYVVLFHFVWYIQKSKLRQLWPSLPLLYSHGEFVGYIHLSEFLVWKIYLIFVLFCFVKCVWWLFCFLHLMVCGALSHVSRDSTLAC